MQGWSKGEYGLSRDSKNQKDLGLRTQGGGRSFTTCGLQAPPVGGPPAPGQMDEEQRMSGLLTGKHVPKIGWLEKASAEMCDPANIHICLWRDYCSTEIAQLLKDKNEEGLKQAWNILNIIC